MVAIFTGLGAGFTHGSRTTLGSSGLLGQPGLGRAGEGVFLNAETGNLVLTQQDEFLAGVGPDATIGRTFNSAGALNENGDNWRQSTDRRLILTGVANATGSSITRLLGDGSRVTWNWNGTAYVTSDLAGEGQVISYGSSKWTWRDNRSHLTETYAGAFFTNSEGGQNSFITSLADDDGNTLTFAYKAGGPGGQLDTVTTQDGEWVQYLYNNDNATDITSMVTHYGVSGASTLTRTRYAYDAQHRLTQVIVDLTPEDNSITDGKVFTTNYDYDASGRLIGIKQPDSPSGGYSLAITYDANVPPRVIKLVQAVTGAATRTTEITYASGYADIKSYTQEYVNSSTPSVTTRVAYAVYGSMGDMTDVTGPMSENWHYTYDTGTGRLTQARDSTLATTGYTYDANGNVATVTDANNNVVNRTYDSNNNLILESHTGANAGNAAATLYTRYIYDSENHLRYSISSEGRVTEYRYDSPGNLLYTMGT